MALKVLLADHNRLVREAVRRLLEQQPEIKVVAEVQDGRAAVRAALADAPDVVLMDLTMPGLSGLAAMRLMRAEDPTLRILAMSLHVDRQLVQTALEAGATGYLAKNAAGKELIAAVTAVANRQFFLCREAASAVAGEARNGRDKAAPQPSFSAPEREVLQLLAGGHTSDETAAHLGLSSGVLRARLRRIVEKLTRDAGALRDGHSPTAAEEGSGHSS